MSVTINIKGNNETNEFQDALSLKQMFEKEFSTKEINGEILIICNATLFGQTTKDVDLIALGSFDNYRCKLKTKAVGPNKDELSLTERTVFVNNFCFCFESKRHRAEDVQLNGLNLLVKYKNRWSDATTQSENQKYSLKNFFADRLNFSPYIANFIWLKNIDWQSIKSLLSNNDKLYTKHNYLPNIFSFPFLMQLACVQQPPYNGRDKDGNYKNYCSFSSLKHNDQFDYNRMSEAFDLFTKVKEGVGNLTRKKIEQITKKLLDDQQYAQAIGVKLIVIAGRAGTGKTMKLLRIACDLAINNGARSLILTYNHALVSDIKRTLALAEIPDGVDSYSVNITTLHKFVFELIIGFGLVSNPVDPEKDVKFIPDFITKYQEYLEELNNCIDEGLIQEKEIQDLMRSKHDKVAWDYILIDEAQDWNDLEKKLIFKIFGKNKTIVADGIDQLIRSAKKCNWIQGLKPDIDFKKTNEKRGLRQEVNLVSFVNKYAKAAGINWELEPKQELIGGKIVVSLSAYTKELHELHLKECKRKGNSEYEMLFLVPPSLVTKGTTINKYKDTIKSSTFKFKSEFEQMGINIWDGTSLDLRTEYAVDVNQHRLLQYESCRGLEGWTVVCLELDQFIKWKMEKFSDDGGNELALESLEERRHKFVYLWSLIPLTRAIDTLIITIKDPGSDVAKLLRKVYEENPDFVQWVD
ncbi:AAA family ATPase [Flavitalea sp.]|nr:AAA family ATPase [Flavitalea sp.]